MIAASGYATQGQDGPGKLALAGITLEKGHYPFKNYRHAHAQSVFFAGCNFPSLYPKTCKALVELFAQHGVGTAYDCCGKPLAMMGRDADFKRICNGIAKRLSKRGCSELVCACPNCLYALRGNIPQHVISVYDKLDQLGVKNAAGGNTAADSSAVYFPPCPDRREGLIYAKASRYLPANIRTLQCAGQHGCSKGETCSGCKALPCCRQDLGSVIDQSSSIVTACASCCGYLTAAGFKDVRLLLSDILGIDEKPAMATSFINRARTKLA